MINVDVPATVRITSPNALQGFVIAPPARLTVMSLPNIMPFSIDESANLANSLFGRSAADALILIRQNRIFSTLSYLSNLTLLFLGCILFTLVAFNASKTIWETVARWIFVCCIPLSFLQVIFGTLRLMTDILRLLAVRFEVWYLVFQTTLYFWGCVSLTSHLDWQCVVWSTIVQWSVNIILIDAMADSSRKRSGYTGIPICILISLYTTCLTNNCRYLV